MPELTPGALRHIKAADRALTHAEASLYLAADLLQAAADRPESADEDYASAADRTLRFAESLADISGAVMRAAADETAPDPDAFNG